MAAKISSLIVRILTIDPKNRIANQRVGSLVGQDLIDQLQTELEKLGG
jgi:hypothetical protein